MEPVASIVLKFYENTAVSGDGNLEENFRGDVDINGNTTDLVLLLVKVFEYAPSFKEMVKVALDINNQNKQI